MRKTNKQLIEENKKLTLELNRISKVKNIHKVVNIIGGEVMFLGDYSGSSIRFENKKHIIEISFDGTGEKFTDIGIYKKKYKVETEKLIAKIK